MLLGSAPLDHYSFLNLRSLAGVLGGFMLDSSITVRNNISFLDDHLMPRSQNSCIAASTIETGSHRFHLHLGQLALLEPAVLLVHHNAMIA